MSFFLYLPVVSQQGPYDLGFSSTTSECSYCATLQVKSAGEPFNIGGFSFVFGYDKSVLAFSSYNSLNFDEQTTCGGTSPLFSQQTPFTAVDSLVSSGVAPTSFTSFTSCPTVSDAWVNVAEICFDIIDQSPGASGKLSWSSNMTQFVLTTSEDLISPLPLGTLTNLDESILCNVSSDIQSLNSSSFALFPNPVRNSLNIKYESVNNVRFEIIDRTGIIVESGTLTSDVLNIDNLSSGVYYLRVNENGNYATQKFIKL